jgi:hypothetical protein
VTKGERGACEISLDLGLALCDLSGNEKKPTSSPSGEERGSPRGDSPENRQPGKARKEASPRDVKMAGRIINFPSTHLAFPSTSDLEKSFGSSPRLVLQILLYVHCRLPPLRFALEHDGLLLEARRSSGPLGAYIGERGSGAQGELESKQDSFVKVGGG